MQISLEKDIILQSKKSPIEFNQGTFCKMKFQNSYPNMDYLSLVTFSNSTSYNTGESAGTISCCPFSP